MPNEVYYDSCVFLQAFNTKHPEHKSCVALTDPEQIGWGVCLCAELIGSESTIGELLQQFQISCAIRGITVVDIPFSIANTTQKKHLQVKKALSTKGFKQRDWKHLMCAIGVRAGYLCTVDEDFWDSANKANPKARTKKTATQKTIEDTFPILIRTPSEIICAFEANCI